MRVLWVVNLILPAFAGEKGLPFSEREGWLSGIYAAVRGAGEKEGKPDGFSLAVAYPLPAGAASARPGEPAGLKQPPAEEWDGVRWYGFHEELAHPERYDARMEEEFQRILADFAPDIVHIFGTEFPHALACLRALSDPARALIGMQGFCGGIAERYRAGLPEKVWRGATFRDRIRGDSLLRQQEKFRQRAEWERQALLLAGHVTGRTDYDRRVTGEIHPARVYHAMNETLRETFYTGTWRQAGAEPHRIFLAQGDYPLKGFHYLLGALALLAGDYPDARLAVAGNSVIGGDGRRIPLFLRIGAYGKYLRDLIAENGLEERILLCGRLDAAHMKEEYLRASVFVCPSELENSPNAVGEAMLLGVPVVASRTGGIPSLLAENREGLLVEPGDVEGLARAIRQIWEEPVIAGVYGGNAGKRARMTHDPSVNLRRLFEIYGEIGARGDGAGSGRS